MKSTAIKIDLPIWDKSKFKSVFYESHAKLYWARVHAHAVSVTWEDAVKKHFEALLGKNGFQRKDLHNYNLFPRLSFQIQLHLGDSIRNSRSALDYLVSKLAREANLPDKHTAFPFYDNRETMEASFFVKENDAKSNKNRRVKATKKLNLEYPELKKLILEEIQPYSATDGAKQSGDLLWRIITSDNIDKHRLMTPTVDVGSNFAVTTSRRSGISGLGRIDSGLIDYPPETYLEPKSYFEIDLLFQHTTKLSRKPITSTLVQIHDRIDEIIGLFEQTFFTDNSK